ncbi:putative membrane protein [Chlamydia ibidis]|uniref:Membrane protein n=2 Tax=Chlamydia ibidis TaxID=1405396 RepID=A0ABN0N022_9CHLA|nr:putative membrane protein [Chlamydia ibidis]EQM63002.1 putative membrane protein [Chlamydia ibidis 10-1398/6]
MFDYLVFKRIGEGVSFLFFFIYLVICCEFCNNLLDTLFYFF